MDHDYFYHKIDFQQELNQLVLPETETYLHPGNLHIYISEKDKIRCYKVFSTFDLKNAYHQISVIESNQKYTAFETNGKLYELTRISFGVKNGVAEFQRKMRQFIVEKNLNEAFSNVDNIAIAGHD